MTIAALPWLAMVGAFALASLVIVIAELTRDVWRAARRPRRTLARAKARIRSVR